MTSTRTGTLQGDGTYIVTLQDTFTPVASDYQDSFNSRSYYTQCDSGHRGSKIKSVILCLICFLFLPCNSTIYTSVGANANVICETTFRYPKWRGPSGNGTISYNTAGMEDFANPALGEKEGRLSWAQNLHDLIIRNTTQEDSGIYTCTGSQLMDSENLTVIVHPQPPVISDIVKLADNREVVYGNEGQSLTIQCISSGGYPAPAVVWYKDSVSSSNRLAATIIRNLQGDGTYIVKLRHLFTPSASDDMKTLICRSYYPEADSAHRGSETKSVILYLTYPPLVTIEGPQQNTLTAGDSNELSCKVDSTPSATIKWYHGSSLILIGTPVSNILNYSLTPVNRTHYGDYSCKASNGIGPDQQEQISITVRFKPLTTTITGISNTIANGKNTLPLVCTSGSSNPISDITWRINNVITPHTGSISDQSGDYGGMKRRQRLTLTPTRDNDGDSISCEANNTIGTSERSKVTLDLRYRPLIESMPQITAVEGNNSVLTCTASSKPASTFKWYRVGQISIVSQGTGTLDSNKLSYTINNVRRTDAATYRCNANNGIETSDNGNVLLTVYHPPDVTVTATNTTVKATSALITCEAKGVPNSDYKYGKWIQTWPGYTAPVSEKPGHEKLELKQLTYEYSGVYTCSASNGIKVFGTNKEFMEGSVYLLVKSFPIITQLNEKTPSRLKENVTVEIRYYSNVAGSDVTVYRNVNGSRQARVIYTVSEDHTEVDLPVFSHIIKTDGTRALILIQIKSKEDFGFYNVVVSNEIDSSTRTFEIVAKGPPSGPFNIMVDKIQQNTARVSWTRGFHGGFAQTFLIQLSADKTFWRNVETVYGGTEESDEPMYKVLNNLQEATTYHIRMYAFNSEGNSPFSESHNFTTFSSAEVAANSAAVTAGAVGGTIAALLVIVVIVIIILVRRGIITKDSLRTRVQTAIDRVGKRQKDPPEMETDGQDNSIRMYEHLQHTPDSGLTNVYDALKVDQETTGNSKSQYENLPQGVSASPTYMNISAGKLNKNVNQTYENLKLRSEITGEQ